MKKNIPKELREACRMVDDILCDVRFVHRELEVSNANKLFKSFLMKHGDIEAVELRHLIEAMFSLNQILLQKLHQYIKGSFEEE